MTRLVLHSPAANDAVAAIGSIRSVVILFAITVAVVAFAVMSLLARVFREAVTVSARLLAAAATAGAIGLLAVILIGALLVGSTPGA